MTDLAAFLLARIAEDEVLALTAQDMEIGNVPRSHPWAVFSPTRVLAECHAKRQIVEAEPERWVPQDGAPGSTVDMGCPEGMVRVYGQLITETEFRDRYMELAPPSQTLLFLAQVYADHPDFREEWRP